MDIPEPDQGSVGMSAVCATMLEAILSPKAHIAFSGGPKNITPCLCRSSGSFGFSEACPHPAQTASRHQGNEKEKINDP